MLWSGFKDWNKDDIIENIDNEIGLCGVNNSIIHKKEPIKRIIFNHNIIRNGKDGSMNFDDWNKDDVAEQECKETLWEGEKKRIGNISITESKKLFDESDRNTFREKVQYIADEIVNLLCEKNKKYGNSALEPKRIFSKMDAIEQLKVRIDDKLSRISNIGIISKDEDTINDLIGYLFLLKIATT